MFTGLIEQIGTLIGMVKINGEAKLKIKATRMPNDLTLGESIAVNGVCLTLERWTADGTMIFHTLEETLKRTNLGQITSGSKVNMERAMSGNSRFGGHIVSGHVDATGKMIELKKISSGDFILKVELPELLKKEVVSKGSIAMDGVSLTVIDVNDSSFTVELIPTTLESTTFVNRKPGDMINLESDMLAKYVGARMGKNMDATSKNSGLTMEKLREAGFLD